MMSHTTTKFGTMIRQRTLAGMRKPRPPPEGFFCMYPHRSCMQNRLEGYEYCSKHILEDKNSVFKQCNYISGKTGKRCPCAAPKSDKKEGYCLDHSRRSQMLRQKANRKRKPRETPETLLEQIEHYGTKETGREIKRGRPTAESITSRILDYASSSESDSEEQSVEQVWRGDADSDAESIDSEQEDALKHAGVYTAEEVALITKDKLIRLQSLYIEQFKRLQHVMREKRRKYIQESKLERETLGSIYAAKDDPEQRQSYDKLIAMKHYHKRYGREALLHRQSKERRIAASEGANYKPPSYPKCTHMEGSTRCGARTIPLAKFCSQHVLDDTHQILFKSCNYGLGACKRPIPVTGNDNYCPTHYKLYEHQQRYPPPIIQTDEKMDTGSEIKPRIAVATVTSDSKPPLNMTTNTSKSHPEVKLEPGLLPTSSTPSAGAGSSAAAVNTAALAGNRIIPRPSTTATALAPNTSLTIIPQTATAGGSGSRSNSRPVSRQSSRPPSRTNSRPQTPQAM